MRKLHIPFVYTLLAQAVIPHAYASDSSNYIDRANSTHQESVPRSYASSEVPTNWRPVAFWGNMKVNASDDAVHKALSDYYVKNPPAVNGVPVGLSYVDLAGSATLDATTEGAISGGTLTANGESTVNLREKNSITGGFQVFKNDSVLNASASNAIAGGRQELFDNSKLNVSAEGAISSGRQIASNQSEINLLAANSITGGLAEFKNSSVLNVLASNAIGDAHQNFYDGSVLNASASNALTKGIQYFAGNSSLNAITQGAISGGLQEFTENAVLNASADKALNGGEQIFHGDSTLSLAAENAVSGGTQYITDNSTLNVLSKNAISGGVQSIRDDSSLNVAAQGGISGGSQRFYDNSVLNASAEKALNGGEQVFKDDSVLNLSAENAISGGTQYMAGNSKLNILAKNAISGGVQVFRDSGSISLRGVDLERPQLTLQLSDVGTTMALNGQNATVGALTGRGTVLNGDASGPSTLVIDTSVLGSSAFGGKLTDGGGQALNLAKEGEGTWAFTGDGSGLTGTVSVNQGELIVDGDLSNSTFIINSGGGITGNGKLGNTTVKANGSIDSNGVRTLNGGLTFDAGSFYTVKVDGLGNADRIDASSIQINGGNVNVVAGAGDYSPETFYTILSSEGGVQGRFNDVASNLVFLSPNLSYTENTVGLTLQRNDVSFESMGRNKSAVSVASTISEVTTPELYKHLVTADASMAGSALEQLAGSVNSTVTRAVTASTHQVSSAMLGAMNQLGSFDNSLQSSILQENGPLLVSSGMSGRGAASSGLDAKGRVWFQILGSHGHFDGDKGSADLEQNTAGGLMGADWAMNPEWRLGVVGGYSRMDLDAGSQLSGVINSYHIGAYAMHQHGPVVARFGIAYSGHDGDSKRKVNFNGFTDAPKADYNADSYQAFTELAYQFSRNKFLAEPYVNVGYQSYNRDSFKEKGGAAALEVSSEHQKNATTTVGGRFAYLGKLNNGMSVTPRVNVGMLHTFGELDVSTQQEFVSGGNSFTTYGGAMDRNSLALEGGVDVGISRDQSVGLSYNGVLGDNTKNQGVVAQWRMNF
ncbi:autotransporter outer membrane beta-barrel domain-containing protein [Pseudomonas protegens]